jgi:threonine efflux protein
METFSLVSSVALLHLLAISSPGPTFMVVSRYAMAGDRRAGLYVALGVVFATLTWSAFAATGLGTLAAAYPRAFAAIQFAGAAYLIYLGVKLLRGFLKGRNGAAPAATPAAAPDSPWRAIAAGYVTNISNPKVIAYYTSLFGVVLPADPGPTKFVLVVSTVVLVSALWWSAIACFFTLARVRDGLARVNRWIEGAMGALLVGFGLRLLLSR